MIAHKLGYAAGVDVSVQQDNPSTHSDDVKWPELYAEGYRFAIVRADAGASYNDPMFGEFVDGARANGFSVAAQHQAKPMAGVNDAEKEADHFVAAIGSRKSVIKVVVLDIEEAYVEGADLVEWLWRWIVRVQAAGFVVAIQTNPSYLVGKKAVLDSRFATCPLWIAHWGVTSPGTLKPWPVGSWVVWQYDAARVPGVSYECDRNWFKGDEASMREFFDRAPDDPCHPFNLENNWAAPILCEETNPNSTPKPFAEST